MFVFEVHSRDKAGNLEEERVFYVRTLFYVEIFCKLHENIK